MPVGMGPSPELVPFDMGSVNLAYACWHGLGQYFKYDAIYAIA